MARPIWRINRISGCAAGGGSPLQAAEHHFPYPPYAPGTQQEQGRGLQQEVLLPADPRRTEQGEPLHGRGAPVGVVERQPAAERNAHEGRLRQAKARQDVVEPERVGVTAQRRP
jgi:hypothetical protein